MQMLEWKQELDKLRQGLTNKEKNKLWNARHTGKLTSGGWGCVFTTLFESWNSPEAIERKKELGLVLVVGIHRISMIEKVWMRMSEESFLKHMDYIILPDYSKGFKVLPIARIRVLSRARIRGKFFAKH